MEDGQDGALQIPKIKTGEEQNLALFIWISGRKIQLENLTV